MSDEQGFDLYEFPSDWVGRKTYVTVKGHSRSVPKPYTYKGNDGRNYVLPEYGGSWDGYSVGDEAPMIMRDIGEYTSVVDGSRITSRSSHRDHIRRHDLVELGNERIKPVQHEMRRAGHDIKQAIEQLRSRG